MVLSLLLAGNLTASAQLRGFDVVAENEYLRLHLHPRTTEIAVEDLRNDVMWFSNPQDRNRQRGRILERLSSQLTIRHDPNGVLKNNGRFSIPYNQFEINSIDQGVRIDYRIVEEWRPEHYVPHMVSYDNLHENIISKIVRDRDRDDVIDQYDLIMLTPLGDGTRMELPGLTKDQLFGDYTVAILNQDYKDRIARLSELQTELAEVEKQIAQSSTDELTSLKTRLERDIRNNISQSERQRTDIIWRLVYKVQGFRLDLERIDDVRFDDIAQLVDTPTYLLKDIPRFIMSDLQQIITRTGYTPIEATEDHLENNLDPHLPNLQTFTVPMEYSLDGPNLVVRIPSGEIEYPIEVEDRVGRKHTFPLLDIDVLEFFGAANVEQEGYMFVPDGSGALIDLNNGRTYSAAYNELVYGRDNTLDVRNEVIRHPETVRLPVFGLKQGDNAFFAIIEEGAALARIRADISEKTDNYNKIFAQFTPIPRGVINLDHAGQVPSYQSQIYQGDFVIRYGFLAGDQANYVGMANMYQEYLVNRYDLVLREPADNIPFYLELVAAIDKRKPILGISRTVTFPLTTISQSRELVQDLVNAGIDNIKVKYSGWLDGGIKHDYPTEAKIERVIGTQNELMSFNDFLNERGFELYPSVGFLNVYRNTVFNDFNPRQDGSRLLNRLVARSYQYSTSMFTRDNRLYHYVLSPSRVGPLVDSFLANYDKYKINNISLFDMAREANSDFRYELDRLVNRVESVNIIQEQLQKMQDQGLKIMVDHGNSYALPFADTVLNVPMRSSNQNLFNREVPFFQMALRGYIDYAGIPINLSGGWHVNMLKTLETGSYPYFIGSYAKSSEVKATDFDQLYALYYGDWLPFASELYATLNNALGRVQGQRIVDHQELASRVMQTTYENGVTIIVNYNNVTVEVNGHVVGGEDFIIVEGER